MSARRRPRRLKDAELKASIRARGLKQNLVVHPAGEKDVHAVTAGGRRLKALHELPAENVIPTDFRVPCLVEEPEAALETSLMENRIRAALSPADEFVAEGGVIASGSVASFGWIAPQAANRPAKPASDALSRAELVVFDGCEGLGSNRNRADERRPCRVRELGRS